MKTANRINWSQKLVGAENNVSASAPSPFMADAHSELYLLYGKRLRIEKI